MSGSSGDYWIYRPSGLYDGWRHVPFSTQYPANQTSVTKDVLEWGLIYALLILAFSFIVILPGIRKAERLTALIRILIALFILGSILLCNFGQEWEVSRVYTKTPYRAGLPQEINASIGVKIGLRSVNITLKGDPKVQKFEHGKVNETIDYNERLSWDNEGWTVGRFGFGPNAGKFNQEFREHQRRGSPYPILWIAEYFTLDGEGVRWGRHYLQAGYYTHIMVWTAFSLWILSLILFGMVLRYGGYASVLTGISLIVANVIYATLRNPYQLEIPFEEAHLKFHWGWCFWLCLATGVLCIVIGAVVVLLDEFFHENLADFFNIDVARDLEEIYLDQNEISALQKPRLIGSDVPAEAPGSSSRYDVEMMEAQSPTNANVSERAFRKRSMFGARQIISKPRVPPPIPAPARDDDEDYENAPEQKLRPPRR